MSSLSQALLKISKAAYADDLAEHAVQSPVWTQDPGFGGDWSDGDYFSDDYYDGDEVTDQKTTKISKAGEKVMIEGLRKRNFPAKESNRKRQKLDDSIISKSAHKDSIVIWKNTDGFVEIPMLDQRQPTEFALLKDWKKGCKPFSFKGAAIVSVAVEHTEEHLIKSPTGKISMRARQVTSVLSHRAVNTSIMTSTFDKDTTASSLTTAAMTSSVLSKTASKSESSNSNEQPARSMGRKRKHGDTEAEPSKRAASSFRSDAADLSA